MKWCYFGCSHSSPTWGSPWPYYVGKAIGEAPLLDGYSQGAGNEYSLIKLLTAIEIQKPELIVWQLTDFTRMTLGIDGFIENDPDSRFLWNDAFSFDRARYYTFNIVSNHDSLKRFLGNSFREVDDFFQKHAAISTFNQNVKPLQSLLLAQLACKARGIRLLTFQWWEQPMKSTLVVEALKGQIDWEDVMNDTVWQYLERNYGQSWIDEHNVEGYHLDSEAHKVIADELIIPFLERRLYGFKDKRAI